MINVIISNPCTWEDIFFLLLLFTFFFFFFFSFLRGMIEKPDCTRHDSIRPSYKRVQLGFIPQHAQRNENK